MSPATLEETIPLVDINGYLNGEPSKHAAIALTKSLEEYGAVLIRDPRVSAADSASFVDMMEQYFAQSREEKLLDVRPQYAHQVGATPDHTERPRDNSEFAVDLAPEHRPLSNPSARAKDPKWRFFWRIGERPTNTKFPALNAPPVVPRAFADNWKNVMDGWGWKLMNSALSVAELLAIGLGLDKDALTKLMKGGAHLLAPTGTDMEKYAGQVGTTLAGFHYDISMLSLHGKARYPGLFIWTADGKRLPVIMPNGTLLVQSGIQIEYLTAGRVKRGMHEVVVSEEAAAAASEAKSEGRSRWRVSSTFFAHIHSDASLSPLVVNHGKESKYSDVKAGKLVADELRELELAHDM